MIVPRELPPALSFIYASHWAAFLPPRVTAASDMLHVSAVDAESAWVDSIPNINYFHPKHFLETKKYPPLLAFPLEGRGSVGSFLKALLYYIFTYAIFNQD